MKTLLRPALTGRRRWLAAMLFVSASLTCLQAADDDFDFDSVNDVDVSALPVMELRVPAAAITAELVKVKEPLWQHTRAPAARDILYSLPYKITAVEFGGFSVKTFFNMTNRMQVTAKNLFADIDALTSMSDVVAAMGVTAQEFAQLVPLVQKITLQERKAGMLLQAGAARGPFTIQVHTSLQLGERNFWLSQRDRDAINSVMQDKFSSDMGDKELYKIRTGPGDTRIKLGFNTLNMTNFQNDIGIELILPTSQLTGHTDEGPGLASGDFSDPDVAKANGIRTFRGIRDYLLNPRLGNRGHFGLGCYIEQKYGLFHDTVQLWARASYDIIFAGDEERMFRFNKTTTAEALQALLDAGDTHVAVLKAANARYLLENILPSSFKSHVQPGGIANVVLAANFDINKHWRGALGYDFYAQRQEEIKAIYNTDTNISELAVSQAEFGYAVQHKCFSEIFYHNKTKRSDLGIGLGGDATIAASGIGADWTTYIKCSVAF